MKEKEIQKIASLIHKRNELIRAIADMGVEQSNLEGEIVLAEIEIQI